MDLISKVGDKKFDHISKIPRVGDDLADFTLILG